MTTFPKMLAWFVSEWDAGTTNERHFLDLEECLHRQQPIRHSKMSYVVSRGEDFIRSRSHEDFELFWDECLNVFKFLDNERRYGHLASQ